MRFSIRSRIGFPRAKRSERVAAFAKAIKKPEDLPTHPIIGYVDDLIFVPEFNYLDAVVKGLRAKLQSSNLIAQMTAAAGCGLCMLPLFMAAREPTLVRVLPRAVTLRRSFWLTVHTELQSLARIRVILDFLQKDVRSARKLFVQMRA